MFSWRKLGKVFTPQDVTGRDWLSEFAQAPATLIFDDFVRVYFSCRPPADSQGRYVSHSAYIDLSRQNLLEIKAIAQQPILPLGGLGMFDEYGVYPVSVIRHKHQVLAYYGGWTRCESVPFNVAIGLAISKDEGATFEKYGRGPILSYSLNEPFVLSGPKIRKFEDRFYLFYISGSKWVLENGRPEPVYKIRVAVSENGLDWKKVGGDLIPDVLGDEEAQASPDVFFSSGKYHMFFCYRQGRDYRNASRGYRIGYAHSTDLMNWTRDDAKAGLLPSDTGWDAEMVSYPHLSEINGKIYMFYLGDSVGRWGFGVAELKGRLE
jgi:hypothetical protein